MPIKIAKPTAIRITKASAPIVFKKLDFAVNGTTEGAVVDVKLAYISWF